MKNHVNKCSKKFNNPSMGVWPIYWAEPLGVGKRAEKGRKRVKKEANLTPEKARNHAVFPIIRKNYTSFFYW
jgi:hypothetical protein